jgi:pyridoxine 5-phosphate synthase
LPWMSARSWSPWFPKTARRVTTEGGLDLIVHNKSIGDTIGALQNNGIPVSLFIDPEPEQIKLAHQAGANMIEIQYRRLLRSHRQRQAQAGVSQGSWTPPNWPEKLKLGVNAGHGLCYTTVKAFKGLTEIDEYSIGHSIVSRAALVGLDRAVREMRDLINAL